MVAVARLILLLSHRRPSLNSEHLSRVLERAVVVARRVVSQRMRAMGATQLVVVAGVEAKDVARAKKTLPDQAPEPAKAGKAKGKDSALPSEGSEKPRGVKRGLAKSFHSEASEKPAKIDRASNGSKRAGATNAKVLGCSKCRRSKTGCSRCRREDYVPGRKPGRRSG